MKTYAIITIEHPDDMTAEHLLNYAVRPAINDMNNDSQPEWNLSLSKGITQDVLERKALTMALDYVLTSYPQDIEPWEVIELIEEEHDTVTLSESHERDTPSEVAQTVLLLQRMFLGDLESVLK
jgi:hypothetical protein